ncbi:MAG: proline--tRNA ligase [Clostridiales bacterium]|jgi:prolyl-tRNA synthetase|nr:proline--tRNA ligase [Clostridiales bacterium]
MLLSNLLGERLREKPTDAKILSQIFLLRGGYIKYVSNGSYSMLLPCVRIKAKIENIIREEMNKIGGQEVLMPVVLPRELWDETGRYESVGAELLRLKDRGGKDMLLAMTHEEGAVHLVRDDVTSYGRFPFMLYQFQTKFRDEPRCKGGLIRVREFTMKDAYSFHTSQKDLEEYYNKCYAAYHDIFRRIGISETVAVASDTGMMGGKVAHEFMLLCDAGEDTICVCKDCNSYENIEVAKTEVKKNGGQERARAEEYTPDIETIDQISAHFGVKKSEIIKSAVFAAEGSDKTVIVFIRGDYEVNETKLKKVIKANIFPLEGKSADLEFGYIGPLGLKLENAVLVYDRSLEGEKNMIAGANKKNYHISGVSVERDLAGVVFDDVAKVNEGDKCLKCGGTYILQKGIEVGNIFQLGKKYTESMKMSYLDENGQSKTPVMGCYGIGVGRAIASVVEVRHDDFGPIWPYAIAPWHIHINLLSGGENMRKAAVTLYNKLLKNGYEVIMDDRKVSAGVQFNDADLLGVPYRVIFGAKNFENGLAELTTRDKRIKRLIPVNDVYKEVTAYIKSEVKGLSK